MVCEYPLVFTMVATVSFVNITRTATTHTIRGALALKTQAQSVGHLFDKGLCF